MKRLLLFLPAVILSLTCLAQVEVTDSAPSSAISRPTVKKWDYGVQLGSMAAFSKGYGSEFSTFVSPHVTWNSSNRFSVTAGISVVSTTLSGYKPWYLMESDKGYSGIYSQALVYVTGQYLLSKNLLLNGSLYADVPLTGSTSSNPYMTTGFKGMSMDLQYRLGENATIEAGFNYMNGQGPFYSDPFSRYGSSLHDPFQPGNSTLFNH
ncbi:MAG TPA: hypothetical protein PKJ28_02245 [Bacteroidales bacterium]|nr:hypothetical protein [Bacteroidales bacterium]HPS73765.1 hypothetical protein [Bacteroidales bacterium]